MASSSSAARLLIRDGKSAASLLFRGRTANLTETVQNIRPAIRTLLRLNQTPAIQYPVFSETFPVRQSGYLFGGFIQQESFGKMEASQGKRVVDNEKRDSEEETDFDEEEIDDMDEFDFDDSEEDEDEDVDDDDEEEDKYTKKKK